MAPACRSCRALRRSGRANAGAVRGKPSRVAGRTTRRSPWSCWAMIPPGSSTRSESSLSGRRSTDLGRSLAYGAALCVARFGNANEHADWETAHHVFTHANALHRMLERIGCSAADGDVSAVRGVLHGAMALYLTRYRNVPPARSPGEGDEQPTICLPMRRRGYRPYSWPSQRVDNGELVVRPASLAPRDGLAKLSRFRGGCPSLGHLGIDERDVIWLARRDKSDGVPSSRRKGSGQSSEEHACCNNRSAVERGVHHVPTTSGAAPGQK